ncbi:MAG: polyprenol monophosphomannose synthase [Actinomycetota bacterium]
MSEGKPSETTALVVVPTYNERENIEEVVRRLFDAAPSRVDLLVIDDGSPDGTAELVKKLSDDFPAIQLIERGEKLGLGTAYVTGFKWALQRGYAAVVEMDADLSHDPADVVRLLQALDEADLAIGSRYVPGGAVENWGPLRRRLSYYANVYARLTLSLPVGDSTAGFRAYRDSILRRIDLEGIRSEGYSFQIEMTRRVRHAGGRIIEIPITFVERIAGQSKMHLRIVVEALFFVAAWGIKDRGRRLRSMLSRSINAR